MLARIRSAALSAVDAYPVRVEVNLTKGLPAFTVVGLPDGAVREGKERVLTALANAGCPVRPRRITVNLAPADVRKDGSALDLPIALGLLAAGEVVPLAALDGKAFLGELGLDGGLRAIRGVLSMAAALREEGVDELWVPLANAREGALVDDLRVVGVPTLTDALDHLLGRASGVVAGADLPGSEGLDERGEWTESGASVLTEIRGRETAIRALEIAAAGGHNLMLEGPPGAGKTLLANALPELLPPPTRREALEITRVHSAAGLLPPDHGLVARRPFRAPHHTASYAGIIGGGPSLRPGEASLAHRGILFLDEAPEWPRRILETLRQPLETGWVRLARARGVVDLPARFTLLAAMNPCPCGYHGEADAPSPCVCTPAQVSRYQGRVSGPFRDRIDLWVRVGRVATTDLLADRPRALDPEEIRSRIRVARSRQVSRFGEGSRGSENRDLDPVGLRRWVGLTPGPRRILEAAGERLGLSARGCHRVLRVARTIADLADRPEVQDEDLLEALLFRGG